MICDFGQACIITIDMIINCYFNRIKEALPLLIVFSIFLLVFYRFYSVLITQGDKKK